MHHKPKFFEMIRKHLDRNDNGAIARINLKKEFGHCHQILIKKRHDLLMVNII